jgi:hypothetical protein
MLRRTNIRTTGGATTTPATTVTQAALQQLAMWAALSQLGNCGLAKRESCGSGCSFDPGSGEAPLRRFANRESCGGCQLRSWLRCTNIRTTAGATTTPASTVTQAALRRSASANLAGRAAASTLAQVRRLCGDSLSANLVAGASFDPGSRSGAQTSAQLPEPRQRRLRACLRCTNIRTTGGATTTPAITLAQAALRRFTNRESSE